MIDIEIIENLINEFKDKINKNNSSFTKMEIDIVQINEIEILINKYKELNDEALKQSEWLVEKQKKIEEQEKMIDFMIDWIRERSIYGVDSHEKLKDYFKKKARDENGNRNDN